MCAPTCTLFLVHKYVLHDESHVMLIVYTDSIRSVYDILISLLQ